MTLLIWSFLFKLHKNRRIFEFLGTKYSPILDNVIFCKVSKKIKLVRRQNLLQYSKLSKLLFYTIDQESENQVRPIFFFLDSKICEKSYKN